MKTLWKGCGKTALGAFAVLAMAFFALVLLAFAALVVAVIVIEVWAGNVLIASGHGFLGAALYVLAAVNALGAIVEVARKVFR